MRNYFVFKILLFGGRLFWDEFDSLFNLLFCHIYIYIISINMLEKKELDYYQDLFYSTMERLSLETLNGRSIIFFLTPLLTLVLLKVIIEYS